MKLCIDIDNVLAQTEALIRKVIFEHTNGRVRLSYEDIVEFDLTLCPDASGNVITEDEWDDIHHKVLKRENVLTIKPLENVQHYLAQLAETYEIHLATSRMLISVGSTIDWLKKHAIPYHNIYFLTFGKKHETLCGFSAVIEDCYEQARSFAEMGAPSYLIRHPWNANKPPVPNLFWVDNWKDLADILT